MLYEVITDEEEGWKFENFDCARGASIQSVPRLPGSSSNMLIWTTLFPPAPGAVANGSYNGEAVKSRLMPTYLVTP